MVPLGRALAAGQPPVYLRGECWSGLSCGATARRLGQGGKEDYTLALKQYRLAARQGDRQAQYRMGTLREEGLGAPRNRVHAYAWLSLAAIEGMPEAVQARDELEAAMTKPEVKQAQKLSEHWFGKMPVTAKKS